MTQAFTAAPVGSSAAIFVPPIRRKLRNELSGNGGNIIAGCSSGKIPDHLVSARCARLHGDDRPAYERALRREGAGAVVGFEALAVSGIHRKSLITEKIPLVCGTFREVYKL